MTRAIERHNAEEAYVLPIIISDTDWEETPIGKLQVLPTDAKPLKNWSNRDKAYKDIIGGIRKVVKEMIAKNAGPSRATEAQLSPSSVATSVIPPSQSPQPASLVTSLDQSQQLAKLAPTTLSQPPAPAELVMPANQTLSPTELATTKSQRERILQTLYEKRSDPIQTFDREDLARLLGKRWHEIQPDVAYLEEKGYLVTKHSQIRTRIFHMLSITAEGVDFVESGMYPSMHPSLRRIDVFISSPSDVYKERQIVKRVIDRCNRMDSISERYVLRALAYEESVPAEVGKRPQDIVDRHMKKAGSSDLFICIFWHRMGTPVTHEETGERFQSGTEYEFLDAYRNNQMHEKPYILLYRGMKPFPPETDPEQLKAVEAFFKRFEGEHAEFKGLYKTYRSNEEFDEELFQDINTAFSKNLI